MHASGIISIITSHFLLKCHTIVFLFIAVSSYGQTDFAPREDIFTSPERMYYKFLVSDINQDGFPDFLMSGQDVLHVSYYDGTGSYGQADTIIEYLGLTSSHDIFPFDIDNDNDIDILTYVGGWYENLGSATFDTFKLYADWPHFGTSYASSLQSTRCDGLAASRTHCDCESGC